MKKIKIIAGIFISLMLLDGCGGGSSHVRVGVSVGGPYYGRPYGRPHMYGRPSGGRRYPSLEMESRIDMAHQSVKMDTENTKEH